MLCLLSLTLLTTSLPPSLLLLVLQASLAVTFLWEASWTCLFGFGHSAALPSYPPFLYTVLATPCPSDAPTLLEPAENGTQGLF